MNYAVLGNFNDKLLVFGHGSVRQKANLLRSTQFGHSLDEEEPIKVLPVGSRAANLVLGVSQNPSSRPRQNGF